MEKLFSSLRARIDLWKIRQDYRREALFEYVFHKLKGGNAFRRLNAFPVHNHIDSSPESAVSDCLAIFVAYHPGEPVPKSNLDYLSSLAACGFRIIYIHNGSLSKADTAILSNYCEQILCRQNIGQDMGAWKDGLCYLEESSKLDDVKWLLLCNDSNIFLGGPEKSAFEELFSGELQRTNLDLICLNRNFECWMHCQSFFLCFHKNLFESQKFKTFWRDYLPLSHRHHAIRNGEIKLSREVIQNSRISVLYDSAALFREIENGAYRADKFYPLLPLGSLHFSKDQSLDEGIDLVRLQCIFATLDSRNPSHVYALLFVTFLKSPFLKKDLFRHGIFCLTQLTRLFDSIGVVYHSDRWYEMVDALTKGGSNSSYINYQKEAFRKGIVPRPFNMDV